MIGGENGLDALPDDFVFYLAARLDVSSDAALTYLGDWLIAFKPDPRSVLAARTAGWFPEESRFALPPTEDGEG